MLAGLLERVAVALAGLMLGGGLALVAWPMFAPFFAASGPNWPWWWPMAGSVLGLLVFPPLYDLAVRVVVPLLGRIALSAAVGQPGDLTWVLAPAAASFVLDMALRSRGDDED